MSKHRKIATIEIFELSQDQESKSKFASEITFDWNRPEPNQSMSMCMRHLSDPESGDNTVQALSLLDKIKFGILDIVEGRVNVKGI